MFGKLSLKGVFQSFRNAAESIGNAGKSIVNSVKGNSFFGNIFKGIGSFFDATIHVVIGIVKIPALLIVSGAKGAVKGIMSAFSTLGGEPDSPKVKNTEDSDEEDDSAFKAISRTATKPLTFNENVEQKKQIESEAPQVEGVPPTVQIESLVPEEENAPIVQTVPEAVPEAPQVEDTTANSKE